MPRPHANGSSGRAAASATPAAMPTEVSRAEETTAGRPHSPTTSRARRTPPRGATFTTMRSAASRWATSRGSSALRIDSSAATGTSTPLRANRTRSSRSSSTDAQGCSAYSSRYAARALSASTAWSTSQAPFASTRMRACGPIASRTAATRHTSSASDWPRSATLTFAVRQPGNRSRTARTCSAGTAGTVALTGTLVRRGSGHPRQADSTADASHREASAGAYSRNGENSPHPAGPSHERGLADRDAAEPDPHRNRDDPQAGQDGVEVGLRVVGRARAHRAIQPGLLRRRAPPSAAR